MTQIKLTDPAHPFAEREALVLDIETVPLEAALAVPYPAEDRVPPANYKDQEAIWRWREADAAKWATERIKVCSLNPRLGRILCIGTTRGVLMAQTPVEEANILDAAWRELRHAGGRVVTWNGSWDLRFIVLRSLALGVIVPLPPSIVTGWFKRYSTTYHVDCKAVLTNWEPPVKGEGLSEWATFLRLPPKTAGVTGADVYEMAQRHEWTAIADYCAQDVATTAAVYAKLQPVYGV
jgi:hypothetical protein